MHAFHAGDIGRGAQPVTLGVSSIPMKDWAAQLQATEEAQ